MTSRRPPRPPRPIGDRGDDEGSAAADGDGGAPPPAGGGSSSRAETGSKPTPVRRIVAEVHGTAEEVEFPGREFQVGEEAWWIQELGRTRSGRREDPGATMILVGFRRLEDDEDHFQREAWVVRKSLDELSPDELVELYRDAGPFRPVPDEPPPFFGPRGQRGRRDSSRGRRGGRG